MVIGAAPDHADALQQGGQAGNTGVGHHHGSGFHAQGLRQPGSRDGQGNIFRIYLLHVSLDGRKHQAHPGAGYIYSCIGHRSAGSLQQDMVKEGRFLIPAAFQQGGIVGFRPSFVQPEGRFSFAHRLENPGRSIPHR